VSKARNPSRNAHTTASKPFDPKAAVPNPTVNIDAAADAAAMDDATVALLRRRADAWSASWTDDMLSLATTRPERPIVQNNEVDERSGSERGTVFEIQVIKSEDLD
jgi:hypothetical protein